MINNINNKNDVKDKQEDEKENKVRARRNTVYHETEVIDLIKEGNAIPRMDRSATLSLGASPTLFSEGNSSFVDGINLNWTKNGSFFLFSLLFLNLFYCLSYY